MTSIWGNAPDEVFVAMADWRSPGQACGATFMLYYDGAELHRF